MLRRLVFSLAVLSSAASAETLTCPVGGERFAAPEIAVCGEYIGQTMLLMSEGCPPDTLPQCPQNFLPMYKAFSAEELGLLAPFMQSESYESNVDFSPYYLAYIIEKHLNGPNRQLPALLLLQGIWQDPSVITDDPSYMSAFEVEIRTLFSPDGPEDTELLLSLLAFTDFLRGNPEKGLAYLDQAERQGLRSAIARTYLNAVRACFLDQRLPFCHPTALIPKI